MTAANPNPAPLSNGAELDSIRDQIAVLAGQNIGQIDRLVVEYAAQLEAKAEQRGVAWAIGVIDELHLKAPMIGGDFDREYKGIKNTIRDRFKGTTGVDPAPRYPVNVQLANQQPEHKEEV